VAAVLLAGAATALAVPSAAAVPAAPAWGWPLEASAGPPPVLRGFTAPVHRWSPAHRGVDLGAAVGAPVLAPVDGVVVFAGRVVDRDLVSVAGPGGLRVTLEPVAATVAAGAVVRRGQQVGVLAGSPSHCAPQSCLHWGVRSGADAYRDPLALLRSPGPPVLLPLDGDPVQEVPVRTARVRPGGLGWAPV
jgi:murein DD-endopeptidase MepM/ murein hydrolase activator NlpD